MAKELIPVPSTLSGTRPKGDGRLLAKVNVFPLALLGDFVREIQSAGGEALRRSWTLMPSVLDRAFKPLPSSEGLRQGASRGEL